MFQEEGAQFGEIVEVQRMDSGAGQLGFYRITEF